jgi:hypothetical protein
VSRIQWPEDCIGQGASSNLTSESTTDLNTQWKDPGAGNKKISLLDLTRKSEYPLHNIGRLKHGDKFENSAHKCPNTNAKSTTTILKEMPCHEMADTGWKRKEGGALEHRCQCDKHHHEMSKGSEILAQEEESANPHMETVVVNAALLASKMSGKGITLNKPIVVDVELPAWEDLDG